MGAPGLGKGTQTSRLLKKFPQIQSLSSGDILRQQIAVKSDVGQEASKYIKAGKLVPDMIMVKVICAELERRQWLNPQASWLLDGFPRTASQAQSLDAVLEEANSPLNMVVELQVDQKIILERIEARWVHSPSGRVYSLDYNPPKKPFTDDVTGEPLTKRSDDTAKVFQTRLDGYNLQLGPLQEYYSKKGVLETVKGNTSDIIFPQLLKLVEDFLRN